MSWQQDLVNASVSVTRSVFESNRKGMLPPNQAEPRKDYILREMECAAEDLKSAIDKLKTEIS